VTQQDKAMHDVPEEYKSEDKKEDKKDE